VSYLDTNSKAISKTEFQKKCNSNYIYKCLSYVTDTLIVKKINYQHQFGKISPEHYEQIRKLIYTDGNLKIEKGQTIIIKKQDSLYNFKKELIEHKKHKKEFEDWKKNYESLMKNGDSIIKKPHYHEHEFNKEIFEERMKRGNAKREKCIRKFERKYNVKVVYLHEDDINLEAGYGDFTWVKDRGIIKKIFFKRNGLHNLLVLKPDGEYFLSGAHFLDKHLKKLLRKKDWSKHKKDFKKSLLPKNINGKGIFKRDRNYLHKNHCF
jgi:hypothetical protein